MGPGSKWRTPGGRFARRDPTVVNGLSGDAWDKGAQRSAAPVGVLMVSERLSASNREWFRALAESSRDIVLVRDVDGILTYCSPAVWSALGYRPEELEGTNERALIHPVDLGIRNG